MIEMTVMLSREDGEASQNAMPSILRSFAVFAAQDDGGVIRSAAEREGSQNRRSCILRSFAVFAAQDDGRHAALGTRSSLRVDDLMAQRVADDFRAIVQAQLVEDVPHVKLHGVLAH